jgi:hypothetical protein
VAERGVAWADERGVHVENPVVGTLDVVAVPGSRLNRGCLAGALVGGKRALVETKDGVVFVDAAGSRPVVRPELRPREWVKGIGARGALIVGTSCENRVIDVGGEPLRVVFGTDDEVIGHFEAGALVLGDGRRLTFPAGVPDFAYGSHDAFVVVIGESRLALVAGLALPIAREQSAWPDRDRILIGEPDGRLRAVSAASDSVVFALSPTHDLVGKRLHRRVRSSFAFDSKTRGFVVTERTEDEGCNISDNIVAVDAGGAVRVIASGPRGRIDVGMHEGVISYVEFTVAYEALGANNDDKGTSVP